ncbi:MAG: NADH-quinone oxidoreductase subunit N [Solirubrobacteraceae bacterium]
MIAAAARAPHIDWAAFSPFLALAVGGLVVVLVGLLSSRAVRERVVPALTLVALGAAIGLTIWRWGDDRSIISGALRVDDLALVLGLMFCVAAAAAVLLSWREDAPRELGQGEYHALLLFTVLGMLVLVAATNTVTLFVGLELLSISLYVLCAAELRTERSLEAGLKYLIIGSVGSATLVYGLALLYGATGSTQFGVIARSISSSGILGDPLLLTGIGLAAVGLAFKASVAPFHQWTPDVYEGAPTPITAFMAVATKAAALGVFLRLFDVALISEQDVWAPALAALAAITIVVGNVGALGQSSLKRMLAYSSVAQAGYMLGGLVVGTRLGIQATIFYLAVYLMMNLSAFAVIIARERESGEGDDIAAMAGIGRTRPVLAWSMTIAMLALAGIPATAGFVGKIYLIQALVDGDYTWLGVLIVIGSMISLGYYLRVVAAVWMTPGPAQEPAAAVAAGGRPVIAGGSPEADALDPGAGAASAAPAPRARPEVVAVAVVFAAASIFFGIVPGPLLDLAADAGRAIGGIF